MISEGMKGVNIRAVIFDFGGVLVRMVDDRPRLALAEQLGVPLSRIDDLVFSAFPPKRHRGEKSRSACIGRL
jgi:hypothetical protein